MIILIAGASHTGKTLLAQKLLKIYQYPYLSIDHLSHNYLKAIEYYCLIMSENYIQRNFNNILNYVNVIEERLHSSDLSKETLIPQNKDNLKQCRATGNNFVLIDKNYEQDLTNYFSFKKSYKF